jgi:hypothetical protein
MAAYISAGFVIPLSAIRLSVALKQKKATVFYQGWSVLGEAIQKEGNKGKS